MKQVALKTPDRGEFAGYVNEAPNAKASLCVIHGVGEHFTRYQEFADTLAVRGYSVYGLDLFGHGASPGTQGYIGTREDTAQQIDALLDFAALGGRPRILMGHSMGGLLVLYYRHTHPEADVVGYVTCSPWLGLNHKFPKDDFEDMRAQLDEDPMAVHNTCISPSLLFTKEPGRHISHDPLMHPFISVKNNLERHEDIDTVFRYAGEPRQQLYIFAGEDDPICDVSEMRRYAAIEHCALDVWPNMKHEPWNEPDRSLVMEKLADNMDKMLENID